MIQKRLYFFEIFAKRLVTRQNVLSDFTVNYRSLKIPSYLRSTLETSSVHGRVAVLLGDREVGIKRQQRYDSILLAL